MCKNRKNNTFGGHMTSSGNSFFFFPLRQHKLFKVKLYAWELWLPTPSNTPPFNKITHACKLPLGAPGFPHCAWAVAVFWVHPERIGQLPHLHRHKNRENKRKFSCWPQVPPSCIIKPSLSLSLTRILSEWLVLEQHLEGAAVFFPCIFLGRFRPPIIRLPAH